MSFFLGEAEEKLRNATGSVGDGGQTNRRPRRAGRADDNLYRAARQAGLRGLANKFSISAVQLGEVLNGTKFIQYSVVVVAVVAVPCSARTFFFFLYVYFFSCARRVCLPTVTGWTDGRSDPFPE